MNLKIIAGALTALALSCLAYSDEPKLKWIDGLKDVSLYLKPKYDLVRTWDQEFGVVSTLARYGNLSEVTNFCYDPTYPIDFHSRPKYSLGFQFVYSFIPGPTRIGVYTKPKYNLVNLWKEESGVTARLYNSKSLVVSTNLAYVFNYPYISHKKPNWLALVSFAFPLSR